MAKIIHTAIISLGYLVSLLLLVGQLPGVPAHYQTLASALAALLTTAGVHAAGLTGPSPSTTTQAGS